MSQKAQGIKQGDWYAFCQVCGMRFFGSTMKTRWDGLFVDDHCYEERHPQEFIPSKIDDRSPPRISTMPLSNTLLFDPLDVADLHNWYNNGDGNIV